PARDFEEERFFEGCMPVEVLAKRGPKTLLFGPMKPVGLTDPATGRRPYAVVQLRQDDGARRLMNIVGFQTRLTRPEQERVFAMIPALYTAEYARFGMVHRNTYINSPALLDRYFRLKSEPRISFAGQIAGVEGYIESCASGMLVGIETAARLLGLPAADFPATTAVGALALYVSEARSNDFQPMNINFGIIEALGHRVKGKRNKNTEISKRALEVIDGYKSREGFSCANNC
ncbi:MAG: methylenetetrahydrofolate--tRNA-(uracil(54)-C(5))-methyltransferase (FADH(2)-oxidizing) TrmFO, partial [Oscillospiraceae bacterium]|nr:methylenetetrahydrofolate--tRNA-(uracil(54)-C(5))-methyltransferase (FADH(2)-oxidizing) TrmFO [Oscillospiraceae bacterium]